MVCRRVFFVASILRLLACDTAVGPAQFSSAAAAGILDCRFARSPGNNSALGPRFHLPAGPRHSRPSCLLLHTAQRLLISDPSSKWD